MPTFENIKAKYNTLKFNSIASILESLVKQAEENEISYLQFADLLVSEELKNRETKRKKYNMQKSHFPSMKHLEEYDFNCQTTISKRQINSLLDFSFIDNRENLVFIGPPGVGKTHLSIGIGIKAIESGYKVSFISALELIEELDLAELRGELKNKIRLLLKNDLIIIDELGYLPFNKKSMFNFFQFINSSYEYKSLILTTNKDFTQWSDFFMDENVAVPTVDRIIHHSHIFMMGGDSYRLKQKLEER